MSLVPEPIPMNFTTVMEMSEFFIARHHGDTGAAAEEMEVMLRRHKRLYNKLADELTRIAVQEKALESLAGRAQEAVRERGGLGSLPFRERLC